MLDVMFPPSYVLIEGQEWNSLGLLIILISFTYCGIMMAYTFSHFARSVSGGFALYIEMTLLFGLLLPFFNAGVMPAGLDDSRFFRYSFRLVPIFSMASAMRKYAMALITNAKCNHLTELGKEFYCGESNVLAMTEKRSCCMNCLTLNGTADCVDQRGLMRGFWEEVHRSNNARLSADKDNRYRDPSATYEIFNLLFVGIIFNFLAIFLDSDSCKFVEAMIFGLFGKAFQTDAHDNDVLDEMDKVDELVNSSKLKSSEYPI
ncbi:unnamed protein product [Orchesella dallaii]|uniref:Uncharacterized protein n=1 Tax=Orchesella dallaii TaxID=48710 RepID=A0ABP1RC60_9HEXA